MMLRRRLEEEKELYYTPVEYLIADGNQYIVTDYIPVQNDDFYMEFKITGASGNACIADAGNSATKEVIILADTLRGFYFKYFSSGSAALINQSNIINTLFNIKIINGTVIINDTTYSTLTFQGDLTEDKELWLMRRNTGQNIFIGNFVRFTVKNNTVTKLDLTPCIRSTDNKPGLLDSVSNVFYTNQGTGEFLTPD